LILDKTKSYGTVIGHAVARYEQDGKLFDVSGKLIEQDPPPVATIDHDIIETDGVDNAKRFLQHVLSDKPLSKAVLFKMSQDNNQSWNDITKAAELMQIEKISYKNATMWKLPESAHHGVDG